MRLRNGRYECKLCGTVLDISTSCVPRVTMNVASGTADVRVLTVDGREVHRCAIPRELSEIEMRLRATEAALAAIEAAMRRPVAFDPSQFFQPLETS